MTLRALQLPKVGGQPVVKRIVKKRPDNLMLSGLLFKSDCELLLVLLEVANGVVNGLALVLAVEQQREVVGTQP